MNVYKYLTDFVRKNPCWHGIGMTSVKDEQSRPPRNKAL